MGRSLNTWFAILLCFTLGHGLLSRLKVLTSRLILGAWPSSPEPPSQLTAWSVYKIAKKAVWLGIVEAPDDAAAIEKAAAEFKVPSSRLRW